MSLTSPGGIMNNLRTLDLLVPFIFLGLIGPSYNVNKVIAEPSVSMDICKEFEIVEEVSTNEALWLNDISEPLNCVGHVDTFTMMDTGDYLKDKYDLYVIPPDISEFCMEAETEFGVPAELLEAIAFTESRFNADATNGGCKGLCQVCWKYHKNRVDGNDPYDKRTNIRTAAHLMNELYSEYGDLTMCLNAYNGRGPSTRSTSYTRKVIDIYEHLQIEHNRERSY